MTFHILQTQNILIWYKYLLNIGRKWCWSKPALSSLLFHVIWFQRQSYEKNTAQTPRTPHVYPQYDFIPKISEKISKYFTFSRIAENEKNSDHGSMNSSSSHSKMALQTELSARVSVESQYYNYTLSCSPQLLIKDVSCLLCRQVNVFLATCLQSREKSMLEQE